ncbi:MAG: hypothetical protein NTV08_08760 [Verrucomicrobia bacterium]|nr:hypothetical protein [Verrucomicrobiota bacterium]
MKVHVLQIPEDGLHIEGEEPSEILDLQHARTRATGPIEYSLDVGLSDGGLFATGTLAVDVECECVRCLEKFPRTLSVDDFACQVELEGREMVDLTEHVREDILLALPAHPHCDWDGEKVCKVQFRDAPSEAEPLDDPRDVWKGLDQLKL